ncbi:LysE family translocator [Ahrensia sp. R2A130]|uniref:LysE family translocator n=1 Tax=Ahrensia sp. R2A130 TaxID=744979 RepID=UPI0001E0A47A|nr:LysE family translocator [Ahrensia sp. R2A130]EFL89668.1 lysine exporter protein LysE/YggA [Ahrensia sp. R2A130]
MPVIPELSIILAFTGAALLLAITPGPDMTLFLGRTIAYGRAAGLASLTGAATGTVVHTILVVAGISALLVASPTGFWMLKIVGALYLAWLAIDAIRNGSTLRLDPDSVEKKTDRRGDVVPAFLFGIGINLLNPKIVLFYMTFLPQFVSINDPDAQGKMLFLGLFFPLITWPFLALMILGAERVAHTLTKRPAVARGIDWLFASVFGFFAVKILLAEGK